MRIVVALLGLVGVLSCTKVPVSDIDARFDLADAAWFADEETLFFFYELSAEQGLSRFSVVEITYRTDTEDVPGRASTRWTTSTRTSRWTVGSRGGAGA